MVVVGASVVVVVVVVVVVGVEVVDAGVLVSADDGGLVAGSWLAVVSADVDNDGAGVVLTLGDGVLGALPEVCRSVIMTPAPMASTASAVPTATTSGRRYQASAAAPITSGSAARFVRARGRGEVPTRSSRGFVVVLAGADRHDAGIVVRFRPGQRRSGRGFDRHLGHDGRVAHRSRAPSAPAPVSPSPGRCAARNARARPRRSGAAEAPKSRVHRTAPTASWSRTGCWRRHPPTRPPPSRRGWIPLRCNTSWKKPMKLSSGWPDRVVEIASGQPDFATVARHLGGQLGLVRR